MNYYKPAKVISPLKFIRNSCARTVRTEKGEYVTEYVHPYPLAERCAKRGDGRTVQQIAMSLV
jgi:hypothetical protein